MPRMTSNKIPFNKPVRIAAKPERNLDDIVAALLESEKTIQRYKNNRRSKLHKLFTSLQ